MKQIVYLSTAVSSMTDNDLVELLQQSRRKNFLNDVTGVLLYSHQSFIQVIEGPNKAIDSIYKSIENDTRHSNIIKVIDAELPKRNFTDWTMGFATADSLKMAEFVGYLKSTDDLMATDDQHPAIVMIKTFITLNKLIISS